MQHYQFYVTYCALFGFFLLPTFSLWTALVEDYLLYYSVKLFI